MVTLLNQIEYVTIIKHHSLDQQTFVDVHIAQLDGIILSRCPMTVNRLHSFQTSCAVQHIGSSYLQSATTINTHFLVERRC